MTIAKPIFSKREFTLCHVPAPKGYPQSQTHAGVWHLGDSVLMTCSPYPNIKRKKWVEYLRIALRKASFGHLCRCIRGEFYENPCIYSSFDGITFNLMQSRPLMESPDAYYGLPAFNSDPDLFVDGVNVYVLNRCIFRTKLTPGRYRDEYMIRLYLIMGLLDEGRFKYISTNLIKESSELSVSPCITKYNGKYILLQLYTNCYNDGENFEGLRYIESETIEGLKDSSKWSSIRVKSDNYIPWHMSVFLYKERLYAIVACVRRGQGHRCWQMLGEFNDELSELTIYQTPLTDYKSYRGSAYVNDKGVFYLYNTTVYERIKGSNSVDGRDVLMARIPFDELMKSLRKEK